MSSFSTINVALSGMIAQQKGIEVTSHNVANANTSGYHRQEVVIGTLPPYPGVGNVSSPTGGQYGTGVEVSQVRRLQNTYLQQQSRIVQSDVGYWDAMTDGLTQVETYLAPGTGLDLSSLLDTFFNAWQSLATNPEDTASRLTVRSAAVSLTNSLNTTANQLNTISTQTVSDLTDTVDRLNQLSDNLAALNEQIGMARAEGREPNDYLDERSRVLTEMTQIAGVSVLTPGDDGNIIVNLGGRALVQGSSSEHLTVDTSAGDVQIRWGDGTQAAITGGKIGALYQLRDTELPAYQAQLDQLAGALATAVNGLHATGVTMTNTPAGDFFTGTTAGSIHVADDIINDVSNIASTTQAGAPGDGSLATDIHALCNTALIGTQTLNQYAQSMLSGIGHAVQSAQVNLDANTSLQELISNNEMEASGVSLDEEMANLLVYQRAYDASAQVLKTADEMIQIILDKLG